MWRMTRFGLGRGRPRGDKQRLADLFQALGASFGIAGSSLSLQSHSPIRRGGAVDSLRDNAFGDGGQTRTRQLSARRADGGRLPDTAVDRARGIVSG